MMKTALMAGLVVLAMSGLVGAMPSVTVTGTYDGANWYVYAKVSAGDNQGLAFVFFEVSGIADDGISTLDTQTFTEYKWQETPAPARQVIAGTYGLWTHQNNVYSFPDSEPAYTDFVFAQNIMLEGSGANPNPNATSTYGNRQYNIRGIGQAELTNFDYVSQATSSTRTIGTTAFDTSGWDDSLGQLIASGSQIEGVVPSFVDRGSANVWVGVGDNIGSLLGQVTYNENTALGGRQFLPEPATLALLAFGGAAVAVRRRKARR